MTNTQTIVCLEKRTYRARKSRLLSCCVVCYFAIFTQHPDPSDDANEP